MNVGSSINFDGRAFVDQQEEELEKEEENRQQELRELLTNALPDDLLEDEDSDTLSENSSISSQEDGHRSLHWNVQDQQKTSTPQGKSPPPLETPATAAVNRGRPPPPGHDRNNHVGRHEDSSHPQGMSMSPCSSLEGPYDQHYEGSGRREAEGSDYMEDRHVAVSPRAPVGYDPHIYYPDQGNYYDNPAGQGMEQRQDDWGDERRQSQQYDPPSDRKDTSRPSGGPNMGQPLEVQVYSAPGDQQPPQMVQYTGRKGPPKLGYDTPQMGYDSAPGNQPPPQMGYDVDHGERYPALGRASSTEPGPQENLQGQYLHAGSSSSSQQAAQLQILYQARGREIEQLTTKLRVIQEENAREKRILNHQLAIAEGEKTGLGTSYDQTKQLLASAKEENTQLQGNLQAATAQIQAVSASKEEIMKTLQTTEATVESLTSELTELQRSQPLARARDHQDTVLAEMQRKQEEEIADLQGRLQRVISALEEKETLAERYRGESEESKRALQQTQILHAEAMNRLTAQLEESQRRCQDLLAQGSFQELSSLHQQLQGAESARQMSESLCKTIQEEAADLKQQLLALEGAVQLGVLSTSDGRGDVVVRNLAKEDWSTPKPTGRATEENPPLQEIQALRKEFERSLVNNRNKRNQVAQLQEEVKGLKQDLAGWKQQAESAESKAKSPKPTPATASLDEVKRLQAEIRRLTEELKAVRNSEQQLREENKETKKQMGDMVAANDEDKRVALERCQNTCMQLHEDRSHKLREELDSQLQAEREALEEAHQREVTQLRRANDSMSEELDKVKQQYLEVCEERNGIEDQIEQRIRGDYNRKLMEMKEKCDLDKEASLEDQKQALESVYQKELTAAKAEKDAGFQIRLKEQLELAKKEWGDTVGKRMVQEAIATHEREWEQKIEQQVQNRLQEREVVCASIQTSSIDQRDHEELERCRREIAQLKTELEQQAADLQGKEAHFESLLAGLKQEHQQHMEREQREGQRRLEERMEELHREHQQQMETQQREGQERLDAEVNKLQQEHQWQTEAEQREGQRRMDKRIAEAKKHWKKVQEQRDSKHAQNLKMLTQQWIEEKKRLEEQYRVEATSMKEKYNSEISRIRDGEDGQERDWIQEKASLESQLSQAEQEIRALQSQLQAHTDGSDQEVCELRGKLCRVEQEKNQMTHALNKELNYMKTRLKDANAITSESLETRLSGLRGSGRGVSEGGRASSNEESSVQTDGQPESHANCLAELQNQYLNTVTQIRADVMQYIQEVREHCQQTVRIEVEKARNSTTKRLRAHFTQCLKDQLQEESVRSRNDKRRGSSTAMLGALNKFLENTDTSDPAGHSGDEAVPPQGSREEPSMESFFSHMEVPPPSKPPDAGQGRKNSVHFSEGCSSSEEMESGGRDSPLMNRPAAFPGHHNRDGGGHEDDQELLQRTFDRLSVLDGSSDCESVMRSDSASGEFMSLEELPLTRSDSSSEMEQIFQHVTTSRRSRLPTQRMGSSINGGGGRQQKVSSKTSSTSRAGRTGRSNIKSAPDGRNSPNMVLEVRHDSERGIKSAEMRLNSDGRTERVNMESVSNGRNSPNMGSGVQHNPERGIESADLRLHSKGRHSSEMRNSSNVGNGSNQRTEGRNSSGRLDSVGMAADSGQGTGSDVRDSSNVKNGSYQRTEGRNSSDRSRGMNTRVDSGQRTGSDGRNGSATRDTHRIVNGLDHRISSGESDHSDGFSRRGSSERRSGSDKRKSSKGSVQRVSSPSHVTFRSRATRITAEASQSGRTSYSLDQSGGLGSREGSSASRPAHESDKSGRRGGCDGSQGQAAQLKGPSHFLPLAQEQSRLGSGGRATRATTQEDGIRRPVPISKGQGGASQASSRTRMQGRDTRRTTPSSNGMDGVDCTPIVSSHTQGNNGRPSGQPTQGQFRNGASKESLPQGDSRGAVPSVAPTIRTKPIVDISGASVTTEYNDLPDKL